MSNALRRTIFAGCRELGLDDDARRDLQLRETSKESLSDMTAKELQLVVNALKREGFRLTSARGARRPAAKRADVRYCHVLWRKLHAAGHAKVRGATGLNAFVRNRFSNAWGATPIDIDAMQDVGKINAVIRALKAWCDREGVELDQ